jgi:hypothetical protein
MQSCDGPSKTYNDVLDQDELKFLQQQIKKVQYPETGKTNMQEQVTAIQKAK